MRRKKVRKPRQIGISFEGQLYIGGGNDNVIIRPFWRASPSGMQFMQLDNSKDCRRIARWLDRAAEYLSSREGK